MTDTLDDNSFLSLIFQEDIYYSENTKIKSLSNSDSQKTFLNIVVESNFSNEEKDILEKCLSRLNIKPDQIKISNVPEIDSVKKMFFLNSPQQYSNQLIEKYKPFNDTIYFDPILQINQDLELKKLFWEKFQDFLK